MKGKNGYSGRDKSTIPATDAILFGKYINNVKIT